MKFTALLFAAAMLVSASATAQLSAPFKGRLSSYNYSGEEGYFLQFEGDAAKELYQSIVSNKGALDTLDDVQTVKGFEVKSRIIYSESTACTEKITDLSATAKPEIKYEYSCEINLNKKGTVKAPARG